MSPAPIARWRLPPVSAVAGARVFRATEAVLNREGRWRTRRRHVGAAHRARQDDFGTLRESPGASLMACR